MLRGLWNQKKPLTRFLQNRFNSPSHSCHSFGVSRTASSAASLHRTISIHIDSNSSIRCLPFPSCIFDLRKVFATKLPPSIINEERMAQMSVAIFDLGQVLHDREFQLHDLRDRYLGSMSEAFVILTAMDREQFDADRMSRGIPSFVDEEARFNLNLENARRDLTEAQQAMSSYIDTKRVPTEDTFKDRTNARNSGNDAPGVQMIYARQAKPWAIRRGQGGIAREAIPSGSGTELPRSWRGRTVDMDSVRFSEGLSNGNGSSYSVEVVDRSNGC